MRMFWTQLLVVTAGLSLAAPLSAGTRSCTSAMVSLNICRSTTDVAYCLAIGTVDPDAAGPRLPPSTTVADAFAAIYGWQSPALCVQDMVAAGICTPGQLGTSVTVTKGQFADMQVRSFVRDTVRRYLLQQAVAAAAASSNAVADPDLGQ